MKRLLLYFFVLPQAVFAVETVRFGLFVGANYGGKGRSLLKYALTDAQAMKKVMAELGGMAAQNQIILLEPGRKGVLAAFNRLSERVRRARGAGLNVQAFFYYSGHSDENGLLLGDNRLPYRQLKNQIERWPAHVKVAILDSCSSGVLTRIKGGRKVKPFLIDRSAAVKGYAVLTASAATEDAQESDRIRASYFTHYLVAGLRGAADNNRNRRVTINEAYDYAYQQTLKISQNSYSGPQHPSFDLNVKGAGSLVLADLHKAAATLILGPKIRGRVFIVAEGHMVAEVDKRARKDLDLAVGSGEFRIVLQQSDRLYETRVRLGPGEKRRVLRSKMKRRKRFRRRSKGPTPSHTGFYSRFLMGPSFNLFMTREGQLDAYDLADLGATYRLEVGHSLRRNLMGFASAGVVGVKQLTKRSPEIAANAWHFGAGVTYFFMPWNVYLSSALNYQFNTISIKEVNQPEQRFRSGGGPSLYLATGKEWPVADNMGIGVCWFGYFGFGSVRSSAEQPLGTGSIQNFAMGLAVTFTYN